MKIVYRFHVGERTFQKKELGYYHHAAKKKKEKKKERKKRKEKVSF